MPAIFTNRLKKQLLDTVYDDLTNVTNRYYVGVGRSEQWDSSDTVVSPSNSYREERNFRLAMQSVKQVADVSYVIPRYNWTSGTIYQGWDDNLSGTPSNAYYVLTEDNQIYVCLQQGRTAAGTTVTSTVKPTGTSTKPFRTSDGYVWKYMYSLSGERTSKYLSGNFVPVQFITDSSGSPALNTVEVLQAQVQEAASAGQVLGVKVTTGGTGYTSAPTVTVQGNGTGASATAFVAGGAVVKIELDSSTDSGMTMGHSYDYASISFTGGGGTGANARVILAQDSGFGYNPINDLRSSSLMFNTKPSGAEGGDWLVSDQDYRQIALIKNPKANTTDSDYTASTGRVLRYLQLTSTGDAASFTRDVTITGGTTGAQAVIDDIDSDRLYAHQNETTGFIPFSEGEGVTGGGGTGTLVSAGVDADSDAFSDDDVNRLSGEILYIENRAAVSRTTDQTEDIKVIITL